MNDTLIATAVREIGRAVLSQDNRITSNPIFIVEERRGRHFKFVTACFTEIGCQRYIAANGHNLNKPRVYVASGYRNEEWEIMREHLKICGRALEA